MLAGVREIHVDSLGLSVGFEGGDAVLSSMSRLLVASEGHVHLWECDWKRGGTPRCRCRCSGRRFLPAVAPLLDGNGRDSWRNDWCKLCLLGEDSGGESVGGVVDPLDDLLLGVEW